MIFQNGLDLGITIKSLFIQSTLLFIFFCLSSQNSYALEVKISAAQSVETSSNLLLLPDSFPGEKDDVITTTAVKLSLNDSRSEIHAAIDLNVSYLDYENNLASDGTRNSLYAEVNWIISRGFYSWYLKDRYQQTRIDTSELIGENNIQNVNELTTGPKLEWKIGDNLLKVDSYITNYNYDNSAADTTSISSSAELEKEVSNNFSMFLSYERKFVTYDSASSVKDYDQTTAGVGADYSTKINQLNVFFGKTNYSDETSSINGIDNRRVRFKRQISAYSYIAVENLQRLTDQNEAIDTQGTTLATVYTEKKNSITYHKKRGVVGVGLTLEKRARSDNTSIYYDDSEKKEIRLSRVLAAKGQLVFFYSDTLVDANAVGNSSIAYNENRQGLEYLQRLNNKMLIKVFYSELSVSSEDVFREYTDNRVGITISISR